VFGFLYRLLETQQNNKNGEITHPSL